VYSRGGNGYLLGFVGLVPWLLALDATRTAAAAARSGLAMSLAFVVAVFAWFGFAIAGYTGMSAATGVLVLLLAAPLLQPQLLAFALVRHIAGRRHGPVVRALAGASAWVGTEWLVPKLFGDTLGHGLQPSSLFRQLADVGGAAGITFVLILVNECAAAAIARRRDGARAMLRPLAIAASVLVLMAGYGVVRLSTLPAAAGKPLRIGMVQSNIVDYERLRREMGAYAVVRHVLDTHYAMSREAIGQHRVDALLWSETVYPTTFGHPKSEGGAELDREIQAFVSSAGVPLVFGTYDIDAAGEYNAAAFVQPAQTAPLGFYRKTDLFPLTESVPRWLDGPTLRRMLPWAGTWQRGDGARVFPLRLTDGREIPVLPLICLDDTDTGLAIDGARLGAQAILGMSNDSWFTDHPTGADLHLRVAAFRSIETRLPQMRVTANGISAVIDATGTVVAATSMGEQRLLIGEVSVREPPATLMVAWGDWVGRAGLIVLVLLALPWVARALKRGASGETAPSASATTLQAPYRAEVVLLAPGWRIVAALLRAFARGSLLWMGATLWLGDSEPMNALAQIRMFASLFLAPETAAWCIARACAARMRIEGDALVLEQRARRIEIAAKEIAAVEPWRLPLPAIGVWLRLVSGQRWSWGIAAVDPAALIDALIRAGAPPALTDALTGRTATYLRTRLAVKRQRILDHPIVKFVLFPLVPALPAFRLHQHIAYGGTFGEYHSFGLQAYLTGLVLWWASWAIGLALFAAALRATIEAGAWLSLVLRPERATDIRRSLEHLGRLLYYVGVPVWLLMRFWPW
jgi:apolipoprotein N-acyltransferase